MLFRSEERVGGRHRYWRERVRERIGTPFVIDDGTGLLEIDPRNATIALVVDEETLAMEAVREVGPGGHYFGAQHTQSRFRTAFYRPILSDWRNYETWTEAGRPEAAGKANRIWKALLEGYEAPPFDPARREALDEFVARRKAEGGVKTDF